jgi:hypothetical protein
MASSTARAILSFLIFATLTTGDVLAMVNPEAMPKVPTTPVITNSLRLRFLGFFIASWDLDMDTSYGRSDISVKQILREV